MPAVFPFRGWRYDLAVAGTLDGLICPPYDVVTPEQAHRLLHRYPRNAIHLELGAGDPDPTAHDNRYQRAGAVLERWCADGTLRHDARPGLYVYEQHFEHQGVTRRRRAFFAAVRLSPWGAGEVLPHEETHAAARADRLALLRATRANISPIYALCDAGLPGVEALLAIADAHDPDATATDEAGEQHRLWAVDNSALFQAVRADLATRPLYIADGHHRYETALAYDQEHSVSAAPKDAGADGAGYVYVEGGPEGAGYVLMAITPVDDAGLVVLPTHRLVRDLAPTQLESGLARLHESFTIQPLDATSPAHLLAALAAARHEHAFVLYTRDQTMLLRPRRVLSGTVPAPGSAGILPAPPGSHEGAHRASGGSSGTQPTAGAPRPAPHHHLSGPDTALSDLIPALRSLDVTLAQRLLFEETFGLTPDDLEHQRHVDYTRDAAEALRLVQSGAYQLAVLLNGTPPQAILDAARAGARMPRKSTYFYPKLATGLVLRRLEPQVTRDS